MQLQGAQQAVIVLTSCATVSFLRRTLLSELIAVLNIHRDSSTQCNGEWLNDRGSIAVRERGRLCGPFSFHGTGVSLPGDKAAET
jgi:hypothetical protein